MLMDSHPSYSSSPLFFLPYRHRSVQLFFRGRELRGRSTENLGSETGENRAKSVSRISRVNGKFEVVGGSGRGEEGFNLSNVNPDSGARRHRTRMKKDQECQDSNKGYNQHADILSQSEYFTKPVIRDVRPRSKRTISQFRPSQFP